MPHWMYNRRLELIVCPHCWYPTRSGLLPICLTVLPRFPLDRLTAWQKNLYFVTRGENAKRIAWRLYYIMGQLVITVERRQRGAV